MAMPEYVNDREWSDRYEPEVKRLIGPYTLYHASQFLDQKLATDLYSRQTRIAWRVRRPGVAAKYPNQFTIRCERDNGTETEEDKIINGHGDWLFYGHAVEGEAVAIDPWYLIDLRALRAAKIRNTCKFEKRANGDGTHFHAYDINSFPTVPPLLIGSSAAP